MPNQMRCNPSTKMTSQSGTIVIFKTYCTVTFTTVLTAIVPDVAVTVNDVAPLEVPGKLVLPEPTTPQPVIVRASTKMTRPTLVASRGSGNLRSENAPAENSADKIAKYHRNPSGRGPLLGSAGSNCDPAMVEKVRSTAVPV